MVRLYSLLSVEDKILEANYFAIRLNSLHGDAFTYELNAFLSAARSVTFYLQKEMAGIPLFEDWWASRQRKRWQAIRLWFSLGICAMSRRKSDESRQRTPFIGQILEQLPEGAHFYRVKSLRPVICLIKT